MPETPFDAAWLYKQSAAYFDTWARRMDVAELPRWSAPALAHLRDANHAAVRDGAGLIPDQLVQLFDAQRRDGARRKCVDIYGAVDDRDRLVRELGLRREEDDSVTALLAWPNARDARLPRRIDGDRAHPTVEPIRDRDWYEAVQRTRRGALEAWEADVVRHQATIPCATFFGVRLGDHHVSCVARYDAPGATRIDSLFVDPDFRGTGFGKATLAAALRSAPGGVAYALFDERNVAMAAVGAALGGEVVQRDLVRRYVGKWEEESA